MYIINILSSIVHTDPMAQRCFEIDFKQGKVLDWRHVVEWHVSMDWRRVLTVCVRLWFGRSCQWFPQFVANIAPTASGCCVAPASSHPHHPHHWHNNCCHCSQPARGVGSDFLLARPLVRRTDGPVLLATVTGPSGGPGPFVSMEDRGGWASGVVYRREVDQGASDQRLRSRREAHS